MIVQILSIFLIFLTEAEAFCCIRSMVDISKQYLNNDKGECNTQTDLREMKWYFTFDAQQFLQLCNTFFEDVKAKDSGFKQILKHFTKIQFKHMKLFEEWTKTLCLIHLPLSVHFFL